MIPGRLASTVAGLELAKEYFGGRRDPSYTEQDICELLVNAAKICDVYAVAGKTLRSKGARMVKFGRASTLLRRAAKKAAYDQVSAWAAISEAKEIISAVVKVERQRLEELLKELGEACLHAARGGMNEAERHIRMAIRLVDAAPQRSLPLAVRREIAQAGRAVLKSDAFNAVLALNEARWVLETPGAEGE